MENLLEYHTAGKFFSGSIFTDRKTLPFHGLNFTVTACQLSRESDPLKFSATRYAIIHHMFTNLGELVRGLVRGVARILSMGGLESARK